MKAKLSLATLFLGLSVLAQGLVSHYTSVDLKKCSNLVEGEGGASAECQGPDGVILKISRGDWTNVSIKYKGRLFETWETLISVGSFTQIGGDNQLIEWIVDGSDGQGKIQSLIMRVNGTNPNNQAVTSKLLVFGFSPLGVCYRGEALSNTSARQLAEAAQCMKSLPVSLPKPPSSQNRYQPKQTQAPVSQETVTSTYKAGINSVSIQSANVQANGSGLFDIAVSYCRFPVGNEATFSRVGAASVVKTVTLGGAKSTWQTTPLSLTYTMSLPKNVAVAAACKMSTAILTVNCDIKPGFGGAGCNYKINDEWIIALESFRNGYQGVLLLPAKQ